LVLSVAEKQRAHQRRYRKSNPDKTRESSRCYRNANRDKIRESERRYYNANIKKSQERQRRYRNANIDKVRAYKRRWQQLNIDIKRKSESQWRNSNPDKVRQKSLRYRNTNKDKIREYGRRRDALKRANRQSALVPIAPRQIEIRLALWCHRCAFCGVDAKHHRNHKYERLTIEHALALTNQGLDEAANIMPACFTCNSSKNATPIEEWYRRQPFFTEARWRKIQRHCPAAVAGQLPLAFGPADEEAP
jgi:hypothetical protein